MKENICLFPVDCYHPHSDWRNRVLQSPPGCVQMYECLESSTPFSKPLYQQNFSGITRQAQKMHSPTYILPFQEQTHLPSDLPLRSILKSSSSHECIFLVLNGSAFKKNNLDKPGGIGLQSQQPLETEAGGPKVQGLTGLQSESSQNNSESYCLQVKSKRGGWRNRSVKCLLCRLEDLSLLSRTYLVGRPVNRQIFVACWQACLAKSEGSG